MKKTEFTREEMVKKYFIRDPKKPEYGESVLLMVGGAVVIIAGLATLIWLVVIGVIMGIAGGIKYNELRSAYLKLIEEAEPKPADDQIDKWFEENSKIILAESYVRLNKKEEELSTEPFMVYGPGWDAKWAKGKDNVWRYSSHNITVFFLTDHQAIFYQGVIDLGTGCIISDITNEFPYKDITNLHTSTEYKMTVKVEGKELLKRGFRTFSICTSGSDRMEVSYNFKTEKNEDDQFTDSGADYAVKALRKRLKEYKDKFSTAEMNAL